MADKESFSSNRRDKTGIGCIILISLYFSVLAYLANSDLAIGRHVLFMDEHITFDGVHHLLHPESWSDFFFYLFDGNDHRYGRILWNISALFSALPEHFYGASGQIIATRMILYSAQLAAYLILSLAFLSTWKFRALALLMLLTLPSTNYYATMPKPEPLQLIFLALFLWRAKYNHFGFGMHWIFLGLAFGTKISVLPILPLIFILATFAYLEQSREKGAWEKPFVALGLFGLGYLIGEPLNLVSIYQRSMVPTLSYINQTFRNTGHGSDSLAVTWHDWLSFIMAKYTAIPSTLLIVTICICVVMLFGAFLEMTQDSRRLYVNKTGSPLSILLTDYHGLILICIGVMLLAPIILMVKRVWGIYLHSGLVFMVVGILVTVETSFMKAKSVNVSHGLKLKVTQIVTLLLALQTFVFMVPQSYRDFIVSASRSRSPKFKQQLTEYTYVTNLLKRTAYTVGRPVVFFLDPELFDIESTSLYRRELFWGPFLEWDANADMVVVYKGHTLEGSLPDSSSAEYEPAKKEKFLFKRHVVPSSKGCVVAPCYAQLATADNISDKLRIFVRNDTFHLLASGPYLLKKETLGHEKGIPAKVQAPPDY